MPRHLQHQTRAIPTASVHTTGSERLKLCLTATKSLDKDKHWALNVENGLTIKSHLLQAAQRFFRESVVMIPLKYDAQDTPSHFINVIDHPENVEISHTQFHTALAFSTPDCITLIVPDTIVVDIDPMNNKSDRPTFQLRVRQDVVAKFLYGHLDEV